MPFVALLVVLLAAVLHAIWNLLAKHARDSSAFMWWGVAIGAIWFGAWMFTQTWVGLPREVWLIYVISVAAEVLYIPALTAGYALGDLSQVYPIARGTPPLLIAVVSALFLDERLRPLGYAGIALLIVGIYLACLPSFDALLQPLRAMAHRPAQLGLLAALFVTIYTLLDKVGVRYTDPQVYNLWVYVGIAIGYAPFVWSPPHRESTWHEFKTNWRLILLGSVATVGSYMLALMGLKLTEASYVGAVRATSVVIGALLGWLVLKESFGIVRVLAAAIMVIGLLLIALA